MMGETWTSRASIFALLCCCSHLGYTAKVPQPTALSVPVRTNWWGLDGYWSPVSIRVGTPPQWVDLFVSTASQETLVIGPGGCDEADSRCIDERGGLFHPDNSKTWDDQGSYGLGLDLQLGFDGDGVYGFDSIAFDDQTSIPSQTIGIVNETQYWLGYFGLGIEPTNFTSVDKPSLLDDAVHNQSIVPSHSYGYTAGAHYRLKGVPSSLTLGGFDSNRFIPNEMSFDLADGQNPVIALDKIVVQAKPLSTSNVNTGWKDDSTTISEPTPADLFTIDSTTPYLWLPESMCSQFEKVLGLVYDPDSQLYTFGENANQHETLVNWNLTFDFILTDLPGSSKSVSLSLPYAAFDLQLSYPYPGLALNVSSPPVNYFPLRKAANSTQYTIGRAFLQETYLIVDYERSNFSISQATFSLDALDDKALENISRPKNSTLEGPRISQTSKMGKGEIAGVAVGAAVALALLVVICVLGFRLRRDRRNRRYIRDDSDDERSRKTKSSNSRFLRWLFRLPPPDAPTEIGGAAVWAFEAPNDKGVTELPEKCSHSELEGSTCDVPAYQEADQKHTNAINAIGHDPEKPVELPYRASARGFFEPELGPKVQFAPPLTADSPRRSRQYRLSDHNTLTTAGISSPSDSPSRMSSKPSSPTYLVSPISPRDVSPGGEYSSLSGMARREAWYVANDDHRSDIIPRRPTPAVSLLSESIHSQNSNASTSGRRVRKKGSRSLKHQPSVSLLSESGESECSNTSTVTNKIRRSISRGFSWGPEQCLDQGGPSSPRPAVPPIKLPSRWNGIRPGGRE